MSRDGATLGGHWRTAIGDPSLQPLHRIDQPVSGVVLFARRAGVQASWQAALEGRAVVRQYIAVVSGEPAQKDELLDTIAPAGGGNRWAVAATGAPGGQEARLAYRLIGRTDHHSVLLVTLQTGRHHQIRVQLAARGLHVVGDAKYGARRALRDRSIALHAWRLTLPHPADGAALRISAPLPQGSVWRAVEPLLDHLQQ